MHIRAQVCKINKLPEGTPQPQRLQDIIASDKWSPTTVIDFPGLAAVENGLLRKFVIVDGNHRIWVLQSLKVCVCVCVCVCVGVGVCVATETGKI